MQIQKKTYFYSAIDFDKVLDDSSYVTHRWDKEKANYVAWNKSESNLKKNIG